MIKLRNKMVFCTVLAASLQCGFCFTQAEAAPPPPNGNPQVGPGPDRGYHGHSRPNHDRMERAQQDHDRMERERRDHDRKMEHEQRNDAQEDRVDRENFRHDQDMERRPGEGDEEWHKRQREENSRHEKETLGLQIRGLLLHYQDKR